jgi:hypothetical protein
MKYLVQHTGRGKLHFLNDELNPLCGSRGSFDHFTFEKASVTDYSIFVFFWRKL